MRTAVCLLLLVFLLETLCESKYRTNPIRFDLAIERLIQYRNYTPEDIFDSVPYAIRVEHMITYLLSSSSNETSKCEKEFRILVNASLQREIWALKVLDAWGKPLPSGILTGNVYWIGNYDECVQQLYQPGTKSFIQQPFDTQHCTLIQSLSSSQTTGIPDITLGICVPSSCEKHTLVSLVYKLLNQSNITENDIHCSNDLPNRRKGLTWGGIVTCIVLSLLAFVVLVGTVFDLICPMRINSVHIVSEQANENNCTSDNGTAEQSRFSSKTFVNTNSLRMAFMAEFSAIRTLRRVFSNKKGDENQSFSFVDGMRVLALFWIIIGHSIVFTIPYASNIIDLLAWTNNLATQLLISVAFSVDTFFVLTGFLTVISFVRQVNKAKKVTLNMMILYYIHRYIRLTPTLILVIMVSINLTPYFGHGPFYPNEHGFETVGCREKFWWTSLLYVGNLVQPDDNCLGFTWYLFNDMQFHWIAPLALIPFVIGRQLIAFIVAILFILVGCGSILGILLYYPTMSVNTIEVFSRTSGPNFYNLVYITPWCRISAYAVGLLIGFVMIKTGSTYRLNTYKRSIGTFLAIGIGLVCVFSMYHDYARLPGIDRAIIVAYQSLSRTLWSLMISWIIFLCSIHQGGIVNTILSYPIWIPLARLNYCAYLIHKMVILITIFNQTLPYYYQPLSVMNLFVSNIFFSYVAAIVVHIFFETPFVVLEKKLLKR